MQRAEVMADARGWIRVMVTTATLTGMREGELRGLMWADVTSTPRRSRSGSADLWGALGPPKSKAGQRVLTMTPGLLSELRAWRLASGSQVVVFPGRQSGIGTIGPNTVLLAFDQLQSRAGIVDANGKPKYVFHACATSLHR
jgi:integrase